MPITGLPFEEPYLFYLSGGAVLCPLGYIV